MQRPRPEPRTENRVRRTSLLVLTMVALGLVAGAFAAPAAAHVGTTGGCTLWDVESDPSHTHVCVSSRTHFVTIRIVEI